MGWIYHNKPPMGWPIDWDSPLPKGLIGYWVMNEGGGQRVNDLSGNRYTGSIATPAWMAGGVYVNNAHNQSVNVGNITAQVTNACTIVTFVRTDSAIQTNDRICANYDGIDYDLLFSIPSVAAKGFRLTIYTGAAVTEDDTEGGALAVNTDYVLAGVYNGANITLYKNGRKAGGTPPAQTGNLVGRNQDYYIGSDGGGTAPWNGIIYGQMIFNRALSPSEIAQLYREPFAMFASPELIFSPGAVDYSETVSDSMGIIDAMTRTQVQARTVAESLGLTDSMTRTQVQARIIAEALGLTDVDSKILVYVRTLAESLGLTDAMGRTQVQVRTETESLGLTDIDSKVSAYARTLAEAMGLTDAVGKTQVQARIIAEAMGLTDDITLQRSLTISEALELTDDMDRIQIQARIVADALGLTDEIVLGRIITIADSLGITDAVTRLMDYLRVEEDDVDLLDSMSRVFSFLRTISDSEEISDSISYGELLSAIWAYIIMRQTHS